MKPNDRKLVFACLLLAAASLASACWGLQGFPSPFSSVRMGCRAHLAMNSMSVVVCYAGKVGRS